MTLTSSVCLESKYHTIVRGFSNTLHDGRCSLGEELIDIWNEIDNISYQSKADHPRMFIVMLE